LRSRSHRRASPALLPRHHPRKHGGRCGGGEWPAAPGSTRGSRSEGRTGSPGNFSQRHLQSTCGGALPGSRRSVRRAVGSRSSVRKQDYGVCERQHPGPDRARRAAVRINYVQRDVILNRGTRRPSHRGVGVQESSSAIVLPGNSKVKSGQSFYYPPQRVFPAGFVQVKVKAPGAKRARPAEGLRR